jgi:hypothetical protein
MHKNIGTDNLLDCVQNPFVSGKIVSPSVTQVRLDQLSVLGAPAEPRLQRFEGRAKSHYFVRGQNRSGKDNAVALVLLDLFF